MTAIDVIHKKVFDHLLERRHKAKEQGEDFFFTIEVPNRYGVPYYLEDKIGDKAILNVLFYGKWAHSLFAYLIVNEFGKVFLMGEFEEHYKIEVSEVSSQLQRYFSNNFDYDNDRKVRHVHGQSVMGSFNYVREILQPAEVIGKIDYFLNELKPDIDALIKPIKTDEFSYFFFDQNQFEEYLKTEPYYNAPVITAKRNLRLKALRVQDFRGIKQTVIDNLPESARWIVLTGENGYGKTSVLQAIAAGLYGNYDESGQRLVPEAAFVGVEYYANGKVVETNSRTPRHESASRKLSNELATYGSARLQVSASVTRSMIEERLPTTYHLFNSDGLLLNVEQLLKDTYRFNERFHQQLINLFKTLIPQLTDIRIDVIDELPDIRYVEQDKTGTPLSDGLSFSQLAAGFRSIIAMIGDMVYRLSTKQKVEDVSDLQGIVLIDELELHLHPTYQKLLPEVLTRQFPHLQFIVSTHSPIPLLGIPKDAGVVLLHVSRSEETSIVVERLDVDFSVLTPNAILSSPIFGFNDLIPESKPDDRMIQPEDTYAEVEAGRELRQTINQFLSPEREAELLELIREK